MRARHLLVVGVAVMVLAGCDPGPGETFARDFGQDFRTTITKDDGASILDQVTSESRSGITKSELLKSFQEHGAQARDDLIAIGENGGCAVVEEAEQTGRWPGETSEAQTVEDLRDDISRQPGVTIDLLDAICRADEIAHSGF